MFLSNHHSFTIVSKKSLQKKDGFVTQQIVEQGIIENTENINDGDRRNFLKLLGGASVGAVVMSMIPSKAQAYIIGSSPTAGIVGVKNASNVGVNPATEDGNLATLAAKDFATETTLNTLKNKDFATETTLTTRASESTLSAIKTNSDKFLFDVSGNLLTAATGSVNAATKIKDEAGTIINPSSEESILYLRRMVKLMESQAVVDNQMRQKVTVEVMPAITIAGGQNLNAINTITSVNQLAGVDARWQIIDWSRQAYNSGIRGNLINS